MEFIEEMHVCIRGKSMDFPLRKKYLPILHLNCVVVKENKIWVAMSDGTLVTNEGRMLGCIQEKLLVSYVLIWDHDHPVAGRTFLLQ
jgi:hypothetical protein